MASLQERMEMVKHIGQQVIEIIEKVWKNKSILNDWRLTAMYQYQKREKKRYNIILENRLRGQIEKKIQENIEKKEINKTTKVKICKTVLVPILVYGSELGRR
ncbi:hypothetical protein ILUMI_03583 [Ignelater luminosus]|uniref:Uncharacterized protein n=1 Tax=Ignelater luminosus TaxID=2038154 RepID=A0A8K0DLI3_IGNLU|nr:hypothetical protein ILUMI_03583 [Ignelater luminosus]